MRAAAAAGCAWRLRMLREAQDEEAEAAALCQGVQAAASNLKDSGVADKARYVAQLIPCEMVAGRQLSGVLPKQEQARGGVKTKRDLTTEACQGRLHICHCDRLALWGGQVHVRNGKPAVMQ